jgi:hypothetical protein
VTEPVIDADELAVRFTTRRLTGTQSGRHETIRAGAALFADTILDLTPDSREQALAITHLEQAVMWANAAIARRE